MKNIQTELNHKLRDAKRKEKEKFETHCASMKTKKPWDSMKAMTNVVPVKTSPLCALKEAERANELNNFYARFETETDRLIQPSPLL